MYIADEVQNFLDAPAKDPCMRNLLLYLKDDIRASYDIVTSLVLERRVSLNVSWREYVLADVDVFYSNDALDIYDKFKLFGISDFLDCVGIGDSAMIIIYEYQFPDIFGKCFYMAKMIHVFYYTARTEKSMNTYIFRAE